METDDKFLHSYRQDPPPGFVRRLRERLRGEEEVRSAPAWRSLAFAAAGIAVVAGSFAFPAVRAGAQAMLDLFRVRSFVAVPFSEDRFAKLRSLDQNNAMMVFDHQTVIQEPGPAVVQSSPAAASAAVGFNVVTPSYLPEGFALDTVKVGGEGRVRMSVSTAKLRQLLATLDLRDVEVPAGLEGQELEVHLNPVVRQTFKRRDSRISLMQARSPEVSLPPGVDLARLAEVGLRILGLDTGEARRIATTVDWRTTLMVPVPMNASSFRSVTVRGNPGLLVTTTGEALKVDGKKGRDGTVVLWTEGDRVYALQGPVGSTTMMEVAESIR